MFFDARAAKLLKPGEHLVVDGCQGLRLEVSVRNKSWIYRYKSAAGLMKQVRLGQWPSMPVQAAAAAWQEKRSQVAAGQDPAVEKKAARAAAVEVERLPTVRRIISEYVDESLKVNRKAAGATAAERALTRLCDEEPAFAAKLASEVTRSDAYGVLDRRKETPTAAAKLRSMLGAAWDHALDAGRIGETPNWWRSVLKGKLQSKGKIVGGTHVGRKRRVLQESELSTLLSWLPNMHAEAREAIILYLWTGTRGAEILAIRPENITVEGNDLWWTIPKIQTKNARFEDATDHRVPLFGWAREVVEERLKRVKVEGWLFDDGGEGHYEQHQLSTYIYDLQPHSAKAKRRKGVGLVLPVTDWTPHNLRRTARTMLAALGCPNDIGELIVGHLPPNIVGTYNAYTYDAERRHWLQLLAERMEQLAVKGHAAGAPARP